MNLSLPINRVQTRLLKWFNENKRDLPWRRSRDPYAIWVSEIMLQQTQVPTVIPYYRSFLRIFPTVKHLAKANLSEVLKIWEGLGYYSRARNLHQASRIIANHFKGKIPDMPEALLSLPGIGRYTAGAILSIAFNKEAPILDGNVKRVLSRLYAITGNPKRGKTEESLWQLSESLIPEGKAGVFNEALMDLGATICTPKGPQCMKCPLRNLCKAWASGAPEEFPVRAVKKKIPHVEAVSAVIRKDGKVLLNRRPPKGLLGGLWEFPNWKIEEEKRLRLRARLRRHIKEQIGIDVQVKESLGIFRHTYSHFKLTLHAFHCQYFDGRPMARWVPLQKLQSLPLSRIHRRIANAL